MASLYARATGNTWSRPSVAFRAYGDLCKVHDILTSKSHRPKHQNENMGTGSSRQGVVGLCVSAGTRGGIAGRHLRSPRKSQTHVGDLCYRILPCANWSTRFVLHLPLIIKRKDPEKGLRLRYHIGIHSTRVWGSYFFQVICSSR